MKVWILTAGEDHEGGQVDSVYADRDLAAGRFMEMAKELSERFGRGLDQPMVSDDGSLYIHSGCDWVSLDPHDLIEQNAIEA
jgi:hypothetical protein